jgi:hypothetical protein
MTAELRASEVADLETAFKDFDCSEIIEQLTEALHGQPKALLIEILLQYASDGGLSQKDSSGPRGPREAPRNTNPLRGCRPGQPDSLRGRMSRRTAARRAQNEQEAERQAAFYAAATILDHSEDDGVDNQDGDGFCCTGGSTLGCLNCHSDQETRYSFDFWMEMATLDCRGCLTTLAENFD